MFVALDLPEGLRSGLADWQRAELTASFVAGEAGQADAILEQLDRFVASEYRARIIRTQRRFA